MRKIIAKRASVCRIDQTAIGVGDYCWHVVRIGTFCSQECAETDLDGWLDRTDEVLRSASADVEAARSLLRVSDDVDALAALDKAFEGIKAAQWRLRSDPRKRTSKCIA